MVHMRRRSIPQAQDLVETHDCGVLVQGIGLVRTEHMFFEPEERLRTMRYMIMSETDEERRVRAFNLTIFHHARRISCDPCLLCESVILRRMECWSAIRCFGTSKTKEEVKAQSAYVWLSRPTSGFHDCSSCTLKLSVLVIIVLCASPLVSFGRKCISLSK